MPRRFYKRSFGPRPVINSIKNVVFAAIGVVPANTVVTIAKAVNTPLSTVNSDVSQGCIIKAVWVSIDFCGLGSTGTLNNIVAYLSKNPGANLVLPLPTSVGTSNEKKFVFKMWHQMTMRNQDGNLPYHWEGWVKIPKRYQRMGTDDILSISVACTAALTGHFSCNCIYKWYR